MTQQPVSIWAQGPARTDILTGPVDPIWMKKFRDSGLAPSNWSLGAAVAGFVSGLFFGLIMPRVGAGALIFGVLGALVAWAIGYVVYKSALDKKYRLWAFAAVNGFGYLANPKQRLPGMIFDIGGSRRYTDVIRSSSARPVEFGNYQYTTGSGKTQQSHRWGYFAIRLDNLLPHIVLDAEGNNGFFGSNLPISLAKNQRLSLEGDFDQYFRLYCPAGYETDALYLFTPDIMVRFINTAAELDVEIIDDWVFFYAKRDLVTTDPAMWAWLFHVVDSFVVKVSQWERWRDDRLRLEQTPLTQQPPAATWQAPSVDQQPFSADELGVPAGQTFAQAKQLAPIGTTAPNPYLGRKGVAAEGRRLKRGLSVGAVVLIAVTVVYVMIQVLMGFAAGVSRF